jgi:hypothetical protein
MRDEAFYQEPPSPQAIFSRVPTPDIGADAFEAGFGESLARTLDLDTWTTGEELSDIYERVAAEVEQAVAQESRVRALIRQEVFPHIRACYGLGTLAGWKVKFFPARRTRPT